MDEETARSKLADSGVEDTEQHLKKIRMLGKGYWLDHDAAHYVQRILDSLNK